jgi:hypothetical protein
MMKTRKKIERKGLLAWTALIGLAAWALVPSHSNLQNVDEVSTEIPSQTFTVINTDASGPGSLRQAITDANNNAGLDTINFNIGGSGIQFFFTMSTLPTITDPLVIDGTTQPGYAGTPLIHIEGLGAIRSLDITGGGTTVKGMSFTSNSAGASNGIVRLGGGNNVITGCSFGVRGDSSRPSTSSIGVLIESNGNRVGGTTAAERNYFAVENEHNLVIQNGAANNRVTGNWFGTAPNGTRMSSFGRDAIRILNSPNNTIGGSVGTTPGGACTGECNVIAGAGNNGVFINGVTATGNRVVGNFVGLFAAGDSVNANNLGIRIENAPGNTVGGTTASERNVITGNTGLYGVLVTGAPSTGNVISGNYIGLYSNGTSAPPSGNQLDGILLNGQATGTRIGGTTAGERNVISGLAGNGIEIAASNGNTVQGNYIGTDATGVVRSTTVSNGISIQFSDNNTIGGTQGTTLGGACTGVCNVISGNGNNGAGDGIVLNTANNNTIDGNYIGVDAVGSGAMVNGRTSNGSTYNGHAIAIYSSNNTMIGRQSLDLPSEPEPEAPAANFCIQHPDTGDYVTFNDTNPVIYFAKNCKTGVTLTGFGTIREYPTFKVVVGDLVQQGDIRIYVDENEGYANPTFPDGELMYVRQTTPLASSCTCPQDGVNVIGGPVQIGNTPSEPANSTRISKTLIGKKADGKSTLNEIFQTHSMIRNVLGDDNTFQQMSIDSGQDFGIDIQGGSRNSFEDVRFETVGDPVRVDPGANGGVQPPTQVTIRRFEGTTFGEGVMGSLQGLPNTAYTIRFWRFTPDAEGPGTFQPIPIEFDVTTDGSGHGTIGHITFGAIAAQIFEAQYLCATATISNGSSAGSTSPMSEPVHVPFAIDDFDGDGRTDANVARLVADGYTWYILNSLDLTPRAVQFGASNDILASGNFNGGLLTDFSVWRPSTGTFYISRPLGNPSTDFYALPWGLPTDRPVRRFDYDGDHRADPTVFRPSTGTWYIRGSLTGYTFGRQFGLATDILAPADYNGDAKSDLGVFRRGIWYIDVCPTCPLRVEHFGVDGDIPVPGDFDGDGKADIAVWRSSDGNWYLNDSMKGFRAFHWGIAGDVPLNIDIDADGKNDLGIWRPSTGDWWILKSSNGQALGYHWGQEGDIPVPKF